MSTIIEDLARWASSLTLEQIPAASRQRVLLQHMHVAGACRKRAGLPMVRALRAGGSQRGGAMVVGGGSAARRDAVRIHSALAAWNHPVDHLFWASTGTGAVPSAWAHAKGKTIGEVLVATVAANEIGGRLGASVVLGPCDGASEVAVTALCSAVSSGLLVGLDSGKLAHAMALSIAMVRRAPPAIRNGAGHVGFFMASQPASQALEAVAMAMAGMEGPLHILDGGGDLLDELSWIPLRNAFSGLGKAWLTESLSYAFTPVAWPIRIPVEAVQEILARHLKAAGRRLRPDQVERVQIQTSLPGFLFAQRPCLGSGLEFGRVSQSGKLAVATLIVGHGLGPEQQTTAWLSSEEDRIRDLAERIEWTHSWDCSLSQIEHWVSSVAPLFAGLTRLEMKELFERAMEGQEVKDSRGFGSWLRMRLARPDRWLKALAYSSGNLADVNWADWQPKSPIDVRLHTIRGGSWPEKRAVSEGAPGASWTDTLYRIKDGFAEGSSALETRADQLLKPELGSGAEAWVGTLLND